MQSLASIDCMTQLLRRMDGSLKPSTFKIRHVIDTDTDVIAESATTAANRWRQSSPIRSPWDVKQRLRLLWRGFFSQVINVQLNKMGDVGGSSPQQPGAPDSGGDN
ncbi:uncharacterized protein LOC124191020 [Daphnia pulex]|uniref:uncharacterized protein LOC124191020 n=1 Tax=Daphnia pulex TaxID=6669 RepID=UPI001EDC9A1F|nr:uncharacterized protein LOC124191020 [Daphnia pulex]